VTAAYPGFTGKSGKKKLEDSHEELLSLAVDATRDGSLAFTLQSFARAAFSVRDLWSSDTWRMVDKIQQRWQYTNGSHKMGFGDLQDHLNRLIINLVAFSGLTTESIVRETGWLLLDIGRRLERALCTISLLRTTLVPLHEETVGNQVMEAVLSTSESVITFRRRYRAFMQLPTVMELLLLDEKHPRALAYQLQKLQSHISALPRENRQPRLPPEERLILETYTELRLTDALILVKNGTQGIHLHLDTLLSNLSGKLWQLSDVITQTYFSHAQSSQLIEPSPEEDAL
ncbi:MAG: alpha-E domain-containing protein, partial [Nitrospiria bacterium]